MSRKVFVSMFKYFYNASLKGRNRVRAQCLWLLLVAPFYEVHSEILESFPRPGVKPITPELCTTGEKGHIYWAAGDQVFRFKYKPEIPIYPEDELLNERQKGKHPPPRNPSEPKGCYDNPIRFVSVPYMVTFEKKLFGNIFGREIITEPTSFHINSGIVDRKFDEDFRGELIKEYFFRSLRGMGKCRKVTPGMTECLDVVDATVRDDYRRSRYYEIDGGLLSEKIKIKNIYLEHGFDAVAIPVNSGRPLNGKLIEGSVELYGVVRLQSGFRLFPRELNLLIPYYRGLIDYVVQAHVDNYRWK